LQNYNSKAPALDTLNNYNMKKHTYCSIRNSSRFWKPTTRHRNDQCSEADWFHIDIMDGVLFPISYGMVLAAINNMPRKQSMFT
jgi:pentose-5-phosphate-3-epimerase